MLQRKQKVEEEREESRDGKSFTSQVKPSASKTPHQDKKATAVSTKSEKVIEETGTESERTEVSTTGRLLAKKRKMKDE